MKKGKMKTLWCLFVLGMCWSLVYCIPFVQWVFYDPFLEMLGCTNAQMGMLLTVYGLGNIYGAPLGGYLSDRFNYKIIYVLSVVLNGVFGLLFVIFPSFKASLVWWVGFSVATLIFNYPAHIKIIRNMFGDDDQGKAFGINDMLIGIGNVIFAAVMLGLFNMFHEGLPGFRASCLGIVVLSFIFAVLAWFAIEDPKKKALTETEEKKEEHERLTGKDYINILKHPATWLSGLSIFAIYSTSTTLSYFTPYFTEVLGVAVIFSGIAAVLRTYGLQFVGAPLGGWLTDKIHSPSKVLILINILGFGVMFWIMRLDTGASMVLLIVLTLAMSFLTCCGRGAYYVVMTELNVPKKYTASMIGIAAAIGFSPDFFQYVIFGNWLDNYGGKGYDYMFTYQLGVFVVGILTGIIVLVLKRRQKPCTEDQVED